MTIDCSLAQLFARVSQEWRHLDAEVAGGADVETIRRIERTLEVELPEEMRSFFLTMNGMDTEPERAYLPGPDVKRAIYFWPVEKLRHVTAEDVQFPASYSGYIAFADFLLDSHWFAIDLRSQRRGPIVQVLEEVPTVVANSFVEFLQKYISSPGDLGYG